MSEGPTSETLARALRELEAAKARVERDADAVARETRTQLVAALLPIMDNLDRTLRAADAAGDAPNVAAGARMVRAQLDGVLRGYGVERVDALRQRFDPSLHDAVALLDVADRGRHDVVVDQLEPCYRLGRAVLRPAKVVVGRCVQPILATD